MSLEPGTIELLASTPALLRSLLSGLPSEVYDRPDEGGWSARDLVAHLVDRGRIQRERVERLVAQPGSVIEDSDEHETLAASGLRSVALDALLEQLSEARSQDVARYAGLSGEELSAPGQHTAIGAITVANLIHQAAYHDLQHLRRIATVLATFPDAGRGQFAVFG
jgi:hypothetical protein